MDDTRFSFGQGSRAARDLVYERLVSPTKTFMDAEISGGVVILLGAIIALIWANIGDSYFEFWGTELSFDLDIIHHTDTVKHWVNNGLMTIFFFVVGLEIKRELLHGELASPKKAALPMMAALGGMVVPALIYTVLNAGGEGGKGWGIPMATDIAFALGVLALVGRGIPTPLRVFLLTLAVADDVGAILVIAFFYTENLEILPLGLAGGVVLLILVMQQWDIRRINPYWVVGILLWLLFLESGVEATIAGVILGLLTPSSAYIKEAQFAEDANRIVTDWTTAFEAGEEPEARRLIGELDDLTTSAEAPLEHLERQLVNWSSFVVVPIFALANSGIELSGEVIEEAASSDITLGVFLGLLVGKIVGVLTTTWVAERLGLGELPPGVNWLQIAGVALLAGIGFTVALFVTELAFEDEAVLAEDAKIGILSASTIAGILGYTFLKIAARDRPPKAPEASS